MSFLDTLLAENGIPSTSTSAATPRPQSARPNPEAKQNGVAGPQRKPNTEAANSSVKISQNGIDSKTIRLGASKLSSAPTYEPAVRHDSSKATVHPAATTTKRKADAEATNPSVKTQRNDFDSKTVRTSASTASSVSPAGKGANQPGSSKTPTVVAVKTQNSSKTDVSSSKKNKAHQSLKNAVQRAPAVPPPKGSFKDIIDRAKANHEKDKFRLQTPIQDKPTVGLTPRELRAQKEVRRQKAATAAAMARSRSRPRGPRTRDASNDSGDWDEKALGPPRERKKKMDKEAIRAAAKKLMFENRKRTSPELQTTYKGTMRGPIPTQSTYKSNMNVDSTDRKEKRNLNAKRTTSGKLLARRPSYTESDEDLEEENDALSDASSDMEADIFDVDQEEQRALKVARLEDAKALKEENELKRKKLERKQALEKLASSQAKKRKVY